MYGDTLGEDDDKTGDSLVHSLMVFVSIVFIILTFPFSCFVCLQVSLGLSTRVVVVDDACRLFKSMSV